MSTGLPYFKFYPADFMGSGKVQMMTPGEVGIYIKLLCHSWQEGPLPDDPDRLWRVAGASPDEMRQAWPTVRRCFKKTEDGLVHPRLEKERADALDRRQKARAAARARHGSDPSPDADARADADAPADADAHADGGARRDAPDLPYPESQSSQSTERTEPTAQDSPLPGGSADAEPSGNWVADAVSVWTNHMGGTFPHGRMGKALKAEVEKHGAPEVLRVLDAYLEQHVSEGRAAFATPEALAQRFGTYRNGNGAVRGRPEVVDQDDVEQWRQG